MHYFLDKMVPAFDMFSPFMFLGSLAFAIAPLLLQYKVIGKCIFESTFKSVKNSLSHIASFVALQAATYSASNVELTIQVWFTLFHTMAPSFRVNIDPDVDFLAFLPF